MVSLAAADARRAAFKSRVEDLGLDWAFFDALSSLAPGLIHNEIEVQKSIGRLLQKGEIGCYSSHFALWQRLEADDADQYIILEDDVIVDWKLLKIIAEHDFAAAGHHYVRLFQKRPAPFVLLRSRYIIPDGWLSRILGPAYGTQGYVITRQGALQMAQACERVLRPIDDQMDRYWDHGIPNLVFFPYPIMEEFVPSSIGSKRFDEGHSLSRAQKIASIRDEAKRRSLNASIHLSHAVGRRLKAIFREQRK